MDNISRVHDKYNILDSVPLGVCILQSNYVVLFWNSCLEDWTKIKRSDILGQPINERFSHFNQPRYSQRLQQIFQGGPPTIFSSQLHKYIIPAPLSQGKYRIQHTTVTSVAALDSTGFYAVLHIQDVTDLTTQVQEYRVVRDQALAEARERQRAQEVAEEANRLKDEFLAIVSHELRTPLNSILGWSKLLQNRNLNQAKTVLAVNSIARNAELQVQLIEDLLDVSRILQGKMLLNIENVNLLYVVETAVDVVRLAAQAKSIELRLELKDAGKVRGDANRLQQIVWNLLSNAVKFTNSGGKVKVRLLQSAEYAIIEVSDTGKGISPDFLPHVFEYFRQADASLTKKYGGLGLGLAIVRKLVEMHGGNVKAESLGDGQGATFTVSLPLLTAQPQSHQAQEDDCKKLSSNIQQQLSGVQVLVVDDDADSREFIGFVLEMEGAKVTQIESAAQALLILPEIKADILVSDVGMPDMDGYMFIGQIRTLPPEQGGNISAIALTAYAGEYDKQQALLSGFQMHLAKPIEPDELIAGVALLTGRNHDNF